MTWLVAIQNTHTHTLRSQERRPDYIIAGCYQKRFAAEVLSAHRGAVSVAYRNRCKEPGICERAASTDAQAASSASSPGLEHEGGRTLDGFADCNLRES